MLPLEATTVVSASAINRFAGAHHRLCVPSASVCVCVDSDILLQKMRAVVKEIFRQCVSFLQFSAYKAFISQLLHLLRAVLNSS